MGSRGRHEDAARTSRGESAASVNWSICGLPAQETRILLCERQAMFRESLKRLLEGEAGLRVIGEVSSGYEARRYGLKARPEIILTGIDLEDIDGLSLAGAILQEMPRTKVVLLSELFEQHYVTKAVSLGVRAVIPKTASASELIETLKHLSVEEGPHKQGNVIKHGSLAQRTLPFTVDPQAALTKAEIVLLRQLGNGSSNRDIALALNISEKTVRNKLSIIYEKLELHNRTQAAVYAVQQGLAHIPPTARFGQD